jgi:hypothetical protein
VIVVSGNAKPARLAHDAAAAGVAPKPKEEASNATDNRPAAGFRHLAGANVWRFG